MASGYDHKVVEKKWQERWREAKAFETPDKADGKENFYFLTEFPYPSGNLHVGHWYAFSVPDIFVRYMRMRGYNTLYPIGFDAFGLPAENAAIKRGLNPRKWTYENIEYMRGQLRSMGASFDWSREVITADPGYYKWTQWLFLQFYKKGLVYRKETAVNWCPNDKTVLANEQVVIRSTSSGQAAVCERCGTEVEQRQMPQWNIKITDYADRLIDDLKDLDWPKQIKEAQINWIGRSEGAEIDFQLKSDNDASQTYVKVFTTRPDTLFGATYLVLAPEHPQVASIKNQVSNKDQVEKYINETKNKTELERTENKEKTGVELKGVKAINPATREEIPMFVADYVLGNYGTGAIMAVPAHDERDFEFAKKFNLPIKRVIEPKFYGSTGEGAVREGMPFVERNAVCAVVRNPKDDTYLCNVWKGMEMRGILTGGINEGEDPVEAAVREICEESGYKNVKLISDPDWTINTYFYHRQKQENRHAHFRILFFDLVDDERDPVDEAELAKHEFVWKKKDELKNFFTVFEGDFVATLLANPDHIHTGSGILTNSGEFNGKESEGTKKLITERVGGRVSKQYHLRDWVVSRQRFWGVPIPMINCPTCGYQPVTENELPVVLPDLEDYLPTGEGKSPLAKVRSFVDIRCPSCGGKAERETDTLDTFVDSSWYFQRYTDPHNDKEFASKEKLENWMPVDFYSGGSEHTTMHLLYSRFWHKAMFDLGLVGQSEPYVRRMNRGLIMGPDGQKMSKSKGNVIDPDAVVAELGADTVRMYLAFIGPYNEVGSYPWNPQGAVGVRRFLDRVWRLKVATSDLSLATSLETLLNQTIKKVGDDISSLKMNTAVSSLMILLNELEKLEAVPRDTYKIFLQLLCPFAPHIAHELAEVAGFERGEWELWPRFYPAKLTSATVPVAVQINGKMRATVELAPDAPEEEAIAAGREAVSKWLAGGGQKVIYRAGKIINFVMEAI